MENLLKMKETYLLELHQITSKLLSLPAEGETVRLQSLAGMFLTLLHDGKEMELTHLFRLNFPEYYADEPNLLTLISYASQPN